MSQRGAGPARPWLPRPLGLALRLLVAGALLYVILTRVPLHDVARALRGADPAHVALGLAFGLATVGSSAARLLVLARAQGMSLSLPQLVRINLVARFYNLALPGTLVGGALRWQRMIEIDDRKAEALAAIAYSRLAHGIALVGFGSLFLGLELPRDVGPVPAFVFGGLLVGLIVLAGLLFHTPGSRTTRIASPGRIGRLLALRAEVAVRFRSLSLAGLAKVFGYGAIEVLLSFVSGWLLARSIEMPIAFRPLAWVQAITIIATGLPISLSGLGIREGGLIAFLSPYGIPASLAVALSFLILSRLVFLGALGAALEITGRGR